MLRQKRLLSENRDAMDQIAAFLIEKETITGKEFMKIFREVKGIPEPEEGKKEEKKTMGGEFAEDAARYRPLRLHRYRIRACRSQNMCRMRRRMRTADMQNGPDAVGWN